MLDAPALREAHEGRRGITGRRGLQVEGLDVVLAHEQQTRAEAPLAEDLVMRALDRPALHGLGVPG